MTLRKSPLLRFLLAIVDAGWWLAPPSRRREWRRQWRADILHEWQWLSRHPRGAGDRAGLIVRATGATALADALKRYKNLKPVSLAAWRIRPSET